MDVITVEDLFFSYQGTPVLQNISFSIEKGEFVGIIGPNGGGKTTLLALLMGFLKPDKGKIRLFDKSPKEMRTKIGWVPQSFHYDRHFPISVLEVVISGRLSQATWYGKYHKEDQKKAIEALERLGMAKYQKSRFAELSGGQAQRVLIARALVCNPELLFLDEPTASVDAEAENEIYKILSSLKGEMTILMVTHDLKAAVDYVERVFCVQKNLSVMSKDAVCSHYALGLYHPPLSIETKRSS